MTTSGPITRARVTAPSPSATVTAEIPVVTAPGSPRSGPKVRRGSDEWYETRRRPAPYALRLLVWLLFFVLLLALAGRAVEHYHPTWLDFLRNSAAPSAAKTPARSHATGTTTPQTGFHEISHTSTSATYSVPSKSYSIVLTTAAGHPCWTTINVPAGSKNELYAETVLPSASPKAFAVTGSASLEISASATSLAVETGGTIVGTIKAPKLGPPFSYSFVPAGS